MPFAKGQSGNPGGRAKGHGVVAYLQKTYGKDAQKLFDALEGLAFDSEDEHVRVKALGMLLDRGWGKPKETHEHVTPEPMRVIHEFVTK